MLTKGKAEIHVIFFPYLDIHGSNAVKYRLWEQIPGVCSHEDRGQLTSLSKSLNDTSMSWPLTVNGFVTR